MGTEEFLMEITNSYSLRIFILITLRKTEEETPLETLQPRPRFVLMWAPGSSYKERILIIPLACLHRGQF